MSGLSPASVLFSSDGYELAVPLNTSIPTGTRSLLVSGSDGTTSRPLLIDSSGRPVMVGAGTAGTPAGGVVTIQGVSGGTVVPVSGTVTANIGTTNGLALDTTLAKLTISQGTALGTNTQAMVGGSVTTAAPTYTNGNINPLSLTTAGALRIDGSGVTQPVSGTVTANAGTGNFTVVQATASNLNATIVGTTAAGSGASSGLVTVQGNASGTPIPVSGTVTATNPSVSTTGTAPPGSATYIGGSVTTAAPAYTTGQMNALSLTTTGLLRIDGSGVTQPVSGTVTANVGTTGGLALDTTLAKLTIAQSAALGANTQALVGGSVTTAAPTYTTGNINPLSLTTSGALRVDGSGVTQPVSGTVTANIGTTNGLALDATLTGGTARTKITDGTNNAAVKAASTAPVASDPALVVAISPNSTLTTLTNKATTSALTSVAGSTSNTTVLASNANRVAAAIYNNTNKNMYLKMGASASTSSFSILLMKGAYWEVTTNYTGIIDAVWDAGVTGSVLVTELTP